LLYLSVSFTVNSITFVLTELQSAQYSHMCNSACVCLRLLRTSNETSKVCFAFTHEIVKILFALVFYRYFCCMCQCNHCLTFIFCCCADPSWTYGQPRSTGPRIPSRCPTVQRQWSCTNSGESPTTDGTAQLPIRDTCLLLTACTIRTVVRLTRCRVLIDRLCCCLVRKWW